MNKTIKLSLATAMIAGMVSNANAKVNLEDAIKDVTVKGYISYTMEKYTDKDGSDNEAQHDIDVRVQTDLKINNNYTATVRIDEANDDDTDKNPNAQDSTDKDSSALELEADQVYVTYKEGGLKVKTGLQKVVAPRLHDSINGDGINASYAISDAVKVVGAYFYTTEKTDTDEVAGLAVMGKAGAVKYSATYATVIDSDTSNGNDGTAADNGATVIDLTVDAAVANINIHVAHTTKSLDATGAKDQKLTKIVGSGKAGNVKYALGYAIAGKDGADVAIDGDADASVNLVLDAISTDALSDGSAIYAMVGTKITDKILGSLEYVTADADAGTVRDASEIMLTVTNKISKKFKTFAKYNVWEAENAAGASIKDRTRVTLGAKYSF